MPRHKFNLGDIVNWKGVESVVVKISIVNFKDIYYKLDGVDYGGIIEDELELVE